MQQPSRKRPRVETGSGALDSDNIGDRRSAPKQRISHACDRCRSRRAKCDGSQPTCVTCEAAHVTCTYGTHTKKRGLPTGYVRMLELLWVLVFDSIPGAEDATLQLLRSATVVAGDTSVALLHNANGSMRDHEKLLTQELWARCKVREAVDARVLKIDSTAGGGSESESTRRVICEGVPLPLDYSIQPWTALPLNAQVDQSTPCTGQNTTATILPASAQVELPDDAWAQIGLYLNYNYCWLPVVPKHDIIRLLSKRHDGFSVFLIEDKPDHSLVAVYHSAAVKELENDNEQTSTHHIAAIILLGLSKMELHLWKDAYLLIGRAARLVQYMCNTTSQSDSTLNRVYLGTFILDTLLSSYLGVFSFLSAQHIMPTLSVYEADGPEEWDAGSWNLSSNGELQCPIRAMSIFGQLARLMVVLNTTTAPGSRPVSVADKLSEWLDQLPKHCSPKERSCSLTPPLANLDMIYWVVKAYTPESVPGEPHARTSSIAEYARHFCTHASKSMLHFCQKLSSLSTHGSGYERDQQSANAACGKTAADTDIITNLSFPPTEQASLGVKDTEYSIDDSATCISSTLQGQSLTRPRQSPTSFVEGNTSAQYHPQFEMTLCQNLDDTETMQTMQTMLEDILAQETGNEPIFSNFMQDLGFFDENVPLQSGSL
ncbi:hypothetical protein Q7P35_010328 [Cladosporium inversicolor]